MHIRDRQSVSDSDDDDQQCSSSVGFQVKSDSTVNDNVKRYRRPDMDDSDSDEWDDEEIKQSTSDDPKENVEEVQSIWQRLSTQIDSFKSPSQIPEDDEEEVQKDDNDEVIEPPNSDDESTSVEACRKGRTFKKKVEEIKKQFDINKEVIEHFQQRIAEAQSDLENLNARRNVVNQELHFYQEVKQSMEDTRIKNCDDTTLLENMNSLIQKCHGYKTGKVGSAVERGGNSPGREATVEMAENIQETAYESLKEALKLEMEKLRLSSKRCHDEMDIDEEIDDAEFYKNLCKKLKTESSNNDANEEQFFDIFD